MPQSASASESHAGSNRLKTQFQLDRQLGDVRERAHFRSAARAIRQRTIEQRQCTGSVSPARTALNASRTREIRCSFKIPGTDMWKSGNVTTGRGFLESVCRKIAELDEDARYRESVAQSKRRQIEELTGLQNRAYPGACRQPYPSRGRENRTETIY